MLAVRLPIACTSSTVIIIIIIIINARLLLWCYYDHMNYVS